MNKESRKIKIRMTTTSPGDARGKSDKMSENKNKQQETRNMNNLKNDEEIMKR